MSTGSGKFSHFNLMHTSLKLSLSFDLFEKIAAKVLPLHDSHDLSSAGIVKGKMWEEGKMKKTSASIYFSNKSRLKRQSCKNKLKSLMAFLKFRKPEKRGFWRFRSVPYQIGIC